MIGGSGIALAGEIGGAGVGGSGVQTGGGGSPPPGPVEYTFSTSALGYGSRANTEIPAPASIPVGSALFAAVCVGASGNIPVDAPTPPDGFELAEGFPVTAIAANQSFVLSLYVWTKVATDDEPDTYTFTHATASSCGFLAAIDGAAAEVVAASANASEGDGTGDLTFESVTAPVDHCLILALAFNWVLWGSSALPSPNDSPEWTDELLDADDNLLYVAAGALEAAGATGAKTKDSLNTNFNDGWGASLVCMRPAA